MCWDSGLSDRALLIHEIMVARPMKLPMTPPSLCSGFDDSEHATCMPVGLVPICPCILYFGVKSMNAKIGSAVCACLLIEPVQKLL
jgi:hypothetical protein